MSTATSQAELATVVEQAAVPGLSSPAPLGTLASRGAFWNIAFSGLNKLVALGSQIGLAWFLLPGDMGVAGIALAAAGIISIASSTIPAILLVQHEGVLREKAGEIFWFSLTVNLAATLALVVFSSLAGHLFRDPRIVPIVLILAVTLPLMALPTVYASQLCRELRFRALAQIKFGEALIRNIGSVILAALGFGAYSLVLPLPAASLYTAINCRLVAGSIKIAGLTPGTGPHYSPRPFG